jgi:hypothetical protein
MNDGDPVDHVVEKLDADGFLQVRRPELDRIAAHPEGAAREIDVVARVLDPDEPPQDLVAAGALPPGDGETELSEFLGRSEAVDARNARDDDHVAPREKRTGRVKPKPVDILVYGRVLLDIGVGRRNERLGLVVIVVADEVLDRVLRKEAFHLAVELRGERFVVRDDERRHAQPRDRVRDREGLPRARDAEKRLEFLAGLDVGDEARDRLGLITRRQVLRLEIEQGHVRTRARAASLSFPGEDCRA